MSRTWWTRTKGSRWEAQCKKVRFARYDDARRAASTMTESDWWENASVYSCDRCGGWHLTTGDTQRPIPLFRRSRK